MKTSQCELIKTYLNSKPRYPLCSKISKRLADVYVFKNMPEARVVTNGARSGGTDVKGAVCCVGRAGAQQPLLPVPVFTVGRCFS